MHDAPGIVAESHSGLRPRALRKNVMLAASISAGPVRAPVRIRNLSDVGAMIDGAALPDAGSTLMLNRLEMSVDATVIWNHAGRCGLSLKAPITVDDWIAGVRKAAPGGSLGQLRVDHIQSAIRSGAALPSETRLPAPEPANAEPLEPRIAAELARVKRTLDEISEELTDDIDVLMRHQRAMQNLDVAAAIVQSLATVVAADDQASAVAAVDMHDLRSRLSGQPTLT